MEVENLRMGWTGEGCSCPTKKTGLHLKDISEASLKREIGIRFMY